MDYTLLGTPVRGDKKMSSQPPSAILAKIAFYQNRRDEIPNQQLARELAETRNEPGIAEIAAHLRDKNKNFQSDCLKVLYEIVYLAPEFSPAQLTRFKRVQKGLAPSAPT